MRADDYLFSDQISYVQQVLVARKINSALSLQLSPTLVHKNIVNQGDDNDLMSVGFGARHKLTSRISLNAEYFSSIR